MTGTEILERVMCTPLMLYIRRTYLPCLLTKQYSIQIYELLRPAYTYNKETFKFI